MKAAIVRAFDRAPEYGDIAAPVAGDGEVLVSTSAAALSQLVRAQAAGRHYSSGRELPLVPGADGVGRLADGQRVYFAFPRAPIGAMAEQVAVRCAQCIPVPDAVDDVTAAAIANPGMSSLAALEHRAQFKPGETVLINGAAGTSGRLAIQIARQLGASRVVGTARNAVVEAELRELGLDAFISLQQEPEALTAAFRQEMQGHGVNVVLDYLWGAPAECIIAAAAGHGSSAAEPAIRFVNIGSLAGATLPLNAGNLRGSGLALTGSGLGSVSHEALVQCVGKLLQWVKPAGLKVDTLAVPLAQVTQAWAQQTSARIVLTL